MSWKDALRRDPGGFYRMRTEQGEVRIFMTEALLAEAEEALGAQIENARRVAPEHGDPVELRAARPERRACARPLLTRKHTPRKRCRLSAMIAPMVWRPSRGSKNSPGFRVN